MKPTRLYDAYIFDLDGTVYLGDALLAGAGDAISELRARGKRTVFLSNNPTRTQHEHSEKLTRLGQRSLQRLKRAQIRAWKLWLENHVQMGLNAGMASALTLTGATTREMLNASEIKPTYVIDSLREFLC